MARKKIDLSTSGKGSVIDMKTGEPVKTPVLPVICERIRHYRELTGMEQKALAEKAGVTANSVSNWEHGRSRPDVNLLPAICGALNITLYDLFNMEDPTIRFSPRQLELLERYERLSGGHKHAIDQMLVTLRRIETAEGCPDLTKLIRFDRPLAAGVGDPTEFEDEGKEYYVYLTPDVSKADCIFKVNGDSMEPDFRNGDEVLVQRIPNGRDLEYGEIGAFLHPDDEAEHAVQSLLFDDAEPLRIVCRRVLLSDRPRDLRPPALRVRKAIRYREIYQRTRGILIQRRLYPCKQHEGPAQFDRRSWLQCRIHDHQSCSAFM